MNKFVGILAGVIVSLILVAIIKLLALTLNALPAGMTWTDPSALSTWLATVPLVAGIVYAGAWFGAALGGGWIALLISSWVPAGWVVALVDLAFAAATLAQNSQPRWMQVATIAAPLLGGFLATRLGRTSAWPTDPAPEA